VSTPTPRTEAVVTALSAILKQHADGHIYDSDLQGFIFGAFEDARQLETELATLAASHERMVCALDKARNGLKWYRDNYHDAESQADDEMEQEIETALTLARNLNQAAK
jgi:hypothetical protein